MTSESPRASLGTGSGAARPGVEMGIGGVVDLAQQDGYSHFQEDELWGIYSLLWAIWHSFDQETDSLLFISPTTQHTSSEREKRSLGVLVLQPKLAPGVADVLLVCRRRGVEVGIIPAGDPTAAQAIAWRTEIALLADGDAVGAVRARQARSELVALVSVSASSAEAFEACDLAIGLSSGRSSRFPARADLIASDLAAVVAIIDVGAHRGAAVRDSVALSGTSNVFGAVWSLRGRPDGAGILRHLHRSS